jgi:hypothetical protein
MAAWLKYEIISVKGGGGEAWCIVSSKCGGACFSPAAVSIWRKTENLEEKRMAQCINSENLRRKGNNNAYATCLVAQKKKDEAGKTGRRRREATREISTCRRKGWA